MARRPLLQFSDVGGANLFPQPTGKSVDRHMPHIVADVVAFGPMEAYFRMKNLLCCKNIAVRMFLQPLEVLRLLIVKFQGGQADLVGVGH